MYTDLESMWQGWTKNLYSLIESQIGNLFLVLILINSAILYPFSQIVVLAQLYLSGAEALTSLQIIAIPTILQLLLVYLWYRKTSEHHAGVNWKHYFLLPIGSLAVSILYLHAAYLVLSGSQVNWKGRRYTVNTSKTIQPVTPQSLDPALDVAGGQEQADL